MTGGALREAIMPRGQGALRLFSFLGMLLLVSVAHASEVLVLLGPSVPAHEQVARAFEREFGGASVATGSKQVEPHRVSTFSLSLPEADRELARRVALAPPALIVAIGSRAYQAVRETTDVPLVFLLVPGIPGATPRRANSAGVSVDVAPEDALGALREVAPRVRRVGVVYALENTGPLVAGAVVAARRLGLTLVERRVRSASEVPEALQSLRGEVDALWMLPDAIYATRENVEAASLLSVRERVPVLAFAERYLAGGAALAVFFDPAAVGRQGAELARRILNGADPASLPLLPPKGPVVKVNPGVAEKLGLSSAGR